MVAGSVGIHVRKMDQNVPSPPDISGTLRFLQLPSGLFRSARSCHRPDRLSSSLDAIQPSSGWGMFIIREEDTVCSTALTSSQTISESPEVGVSHEKVTRTVEDEGVNLEKRSQL